MTREEILEYFKDINYAYNDCTRYDTLKRMIDELQEPCNDCISRQAAINVVVKDILSSAIVYGRTEEGMSARKAIVDGLKRLPPVKPAEKVGRWIDADVLDKIRSEIVHLHDWAFTREEILRIIDKYKASPTGAEKE